MSNDPLLKVIHPDGWKRPNGYSYAMSHQGGRMVHIAGQLPWEMSTLEVVGPGDFLVQWDQALANVATVLRSAGGKPSDIVSMRIFITSMSAYRENGSRVGEAWMKHFGKHFPATTMVEINALNAPGAMIEIEAVAAIGGE